ncbi:N-acetylglucosamine kinase [Microbacterium tumbae]
MSADAGLLGIDAGGTKIHVAYRPRAGAPVAERMIEGAEWNRATFPERARLVASITEATGRPVASVAIGAHGCDSDAECEGLRREVQALVGARVAVVNDAELFGRAMGAPDAINVVLGTGSIVVVRQRGGAASYLGGWGWLVGDDGSAWGIVRNAVRALTDARRAEADPLLDALLSRTGARTLRDVVDLMQRSEASSWAGWADAVFTAEEHGSTASAHAVRSALQHTVGLIGEARRVSPDASVVVMGGGVAMHQPGHAERIREEVRLRSGLDVLLIDRPPAHGALQLAQEALTALQGDS